MSVNNPPSCKKSFKKVEFIGSIWKIPHAFLKTESASFSHATNLTATLSEAVSKEELAEKVKTSSASFRFVFMQDGQQKYVLLETPVKELAVSRIQPVIDEFLEEVTASKDKIDYIHGTDEVFRLGAKENAVSVLLPPVAKDSFFATINRREPLPRKSFSMGEACEKRFYLECRRLFD